MDPDTHCLTVLQKNSELFFTVSIILPACWTMNRLTLLPPHLYEDINFLIIASDYLKPGIRFEHGMNKQEIMSDDDLVLELNNTR